MVDTLEENATTKGNLTNQKVVRSFLTGGPIINGEHNNEID